MSPDERTLAFTAEYGEGGRAIMVAPATGGAPRELNRVTGDVRFSSSTWRNGSHILYFGGGAMWSFSTAGGPPEKFPLQTQLRVGRPAVSPDGDQLAFVGRTDEKAVWFMSGIFPDAKAAAAR